MGTIREMADAQKKAHPKNRMEEYMEVVKGIQEDRKQLGILMDHTVETNALLHELNKSAALVVDELALLINTMIRKEDKPDDGKGSEAVQ